MALFNSLFKILELDLFFNSIYGFILMGMISIIFGLKSTEYLTNKFISYMEYTKMK